MITYQPLSERPDLVPSLWVVGDACWPPFMQAAPGGAPFYRRLTTDFAHCCLLAIEDEQLLARACFIPFRWDGHALPRGGWDAIIAQGVADHDTGRVPTAASALEVAILPRHRGRGLSSLMLEQMRRAVAGRGLGDLVAPVRPSGKHEHPWESMSSYLGREQDGLPADPWVRTHVRAGAQVLDVAPESVRVEAPLDRWRGWTGLPLVADGPVAVPEALVPLQVDLVEDVGRYLEPNVWVHHQLR